jgi:hypothetical protein
LIGLAGVIASNSSCETCPKTTPPNYSAEPISIEHRNLSQFAEQNDVSEIGFGGVYREVSKNESVSAGAYPGQSCPFRTNLVNISAALIIDVTAANSVVTNAK